MKLENKKLIQLFTMFLLLLVVFMAGRASASDEELFIPCGGDDEFIIMCLGDTDNLPFENIKTLGSLKEKTIGEAEEERIGTVSLFLIILIIIFILCLLIFIIKRRKCKK